MAKELKKSSAKLYTQPETQTLYEPEDPETLNPKPLNPKPEAYVLISRPQNLLDNYMAEVATQYAPKVLSQSGEGRQVGLLDIGCLFAWGLGGPCISAVCHI